MLALLEKLKQREGLEIIDSHVHPFDVMGIVSYSRYKEINGDLLLQGEKGKEIDVKKPTIPERFKHGSAANTLIKILFQAAPRLVKNSIVDSYGVTGIKRLTREMEIAGIDKAVLVPIEPYIDVDSIIKHFHEDKFIPLGSIDIHTTPLESIRDQIELQKKSYNIKGIKLHPNLQGFFPNPSKNNYKLSEKLKRLYEVIGNLGLYVLFHSGYSNIFTHQKKYHAKSSYALLENFCTSNGESEVFTQLYQSNTPVILAHIGSYALVRKNFNLIKVLSKKFPNVFFDTAGVSPQIIKQAIESVGSKKLIFGSDALYDRMLYKMRFCIEAINKANTHESIEEQALNIFGRNFTTKILTK